MNLVANKSRLTSFDSLLCQKSQRKDLYLQILSLFKHTRLSSLPFNSTFKTFYHSVINFIVKQFSSSDICDINTCTLKLEGKNI